MRVALLEQLVGVQRVRQTHSSRAITIYSARHVELATRRTAQSQRGLRVL
jgi:hypothetical protein